MTTSGVTDWSLTARDIVMKAMGELAVLESGAEPSSDEIEDGVRSLNGMLKSWQVKDNLWRNDDATVTFLTGTATITLDAGVRSVYDARLSLSATYERPLQVWTRADYNNIPNKAQVGTPLALYYRKTTTAPTLTAWPVPTADTTVILDIARAIETITDPSETVDIPEDWQEVVWSNLALRIAGSFSAAIPDELASRAVMLKRELTDNDRPESYYLGSWDDACYG